MKVYFITIYYTLLRYLQASIHSAFLIIIPIDSSHFAMVKCLFVLMGN